MKTEITISLYTALQVPKVPRKLVKVFGFAVPLCDTMTLSYANYKLWKTGRSNMNLSDGVIEVDYMNLSDGQTGWGKGAVNYAVNLLAESGWEEING